MTNKIVQLKIQDRSYSVSYPNVGQFYQIESLKLQLSNGYYNSLVLLGTKSALSALDMIDIEATLSVMVPQLIKDLKVKNFGELGIADFSEIRKAYEEVVVPLFKEVNELLDPYKNDAKGS